MAANSATELRLCTALRWGSPDLRGGDSALGPASRSPLPADGHHAEVELALAPRPAALARVGWDGPLWRGLPGFVGEENAGWDRNRHRDPMLGSGVLGMKRSRSAQAVGRKLEAKRGRRRDGL